MPQRLCMSRSIFTFPSTLPLHFTSFWLFFGNFEFQVFFLFFGSARRDRCKATTEIYFSFTFASFSVLSRNHFSRFGVFRRWYRAPTVPRSPPLFLDSRNAKQTRKKSQEKNSKAKWKMIFASPRGISEDFLGIAFQPSSGWLTSQLPCCFCLNLNLIPR